MFETAIRGEEGNTKIPAFLDSAFHSGAFNALCKLKGDSQGDYSPVGNGGGNG